MNPGYAHNSQVFSVCQTELSDEEAPPSPTSTVTSVDLPMSKTKPPPPSPRGSVPFTISVQDNDTRQKKISRQSLASLMDIDDHSRPQPRYSIPFLCKSDLSTLKETSSAAITEKRKSIIMERKISRSSFGGDSDDESPVKKISVTSLPLPNETGKRIGTHAYSRLTSIPDSVLAEDGEADETQKENKTTPNEISPDDRRPSAHL